MSCLLDLITSYFMLGLSHGEILLSPVCDSHASTDQASCVVMQRLWHISRYILTQRLWKIVQKGPKISLASRVLWQTEAFWIERWDGASESEMLLCSDNKPYTVVLIMYSWYLHNIWFCSYNINIILLKHKTFFLWYIFWRNVLVYCPNEKSICY